MNKIRISKTVSSVILILTMQIIITFFFSPTFALEAAVGTTLADTTPPTQPEKLRVASTTDTTASLFWKASIDHGGLRQYNIYRDGKYVNSTTTATSFTDKGLLPGQMYTYTVIAKDTSGNVSEASNSASGP